METLNCGSHSYIRGYWPYYGNRIHTCVYVGWCQIRICFRVHAVSCLPTPFIWLPTLAALTTANYVIKASGMVIVWATNTATNTASYLRKPCINSSRIYSMLVNVPPKSLGKLGRWETTTCVEIDAVSMYEWSTHVKWSNLDFTKLLDK